VHTIMVDTACEHACLPDQPKDGLQMTLTNPLHRHDLRCVLPGARKMIAA